MPPANSQFPRAYHWLVMTWSLLLIMVCGACPFSPSFKGPLDPAALAIYVIFGVDLSTLNKTPLEALWVDPY